MSDPTPRRRLRWIRRGAVLGLVVLAVLAVDRLWVFMWDDWTHVRVVASVVDERGEPVAGARLTLVLAPDPRGGHLCIDEAGRTRLDDAPGLPYEEDSPGVESPCGRCAFVRTDEEGRVDVVLQIHRGGTSSLLHPASPEPAFGGIDLVIAEAEGREIACVSGSERWWTYQEHGQGLTRIGATLDLGRLVLRAAEAPRD